MDHAWRAADVIVVGAGAAGLCTVLHLPAGSDVCVVEKAGREQGSSPWAQGGVAAAFGPEDSPALHVRDTIAVAGGHADPLAVEVLCEEAPEAVMELAELGCPLDRTPGGDLDLAREGGQTVPRSAHAGDATGAAIMDTLRHHTRRRADRIEGRCLGLRMAGGRCCGTWVWTGEGIVGVSAPATVVATGGLGGIFASTTNPAGATGAGPALAWEAGAAVADLEFVQFHPTVLAAGSWVDWSGGPERLLLTEALRGAGAHVVDAQGRRFLFDHHPAGELAPRDILARAVAGTPAWLDCRHLGPRLEREFHVVTSGCRAAGFDPEHDLLPISPAAHYSIGGIRTDLDGRSSVLGLYAVGECACTGVHGANRLAGNSLAEALVFGRRAARAIGAAPPEAVPTDLRPPEVTGGRQATKDTEEAWRELRAACSANLGIERDAAGLEALDRTLQPIAEGPTPADPDRATLRAAAICARLVALGALLRTESRGTHRRRDHPAPDPRWDGVRLSLSRPYRS